MALRPRWPQCQLDANLNLKRGSRHVGGRLRRRAAAGTPSDSESAPDVCQWAWESETHWQRAAASQVPMCQPTILSHRKDSEIQPTRNTASRDPSQWHSEAQSEPGCHHDHGTVRVAPAEGKSRILYTKIACKSHFATVMVTVHAVGILGHELSPCSLNMSTVVSLCNCHGHGALAA